MKNVGERSEFERWPGKGKRVAEPPPSFNLFRLTARLASLADFFSRARQFFLPFPLSQACQHFISRLLIGHLPRV